MTEQSLDLAKNLKIINDRYSLDVELGQGGMGTVYRAHDSVLDREVAVKLMSGTRLGTQGRSRLLIEAQTVARLNHANIVTVYDAGEIDDQPYVVMEYVQGVTLNEYQPGGMEEVIEIARQMCTALQHAHDQGIVHRDLKPENVIIEEVGSVRLMDFGLAVSTATRMTEDGMISGTVFYMSPEQAFGYEVTPQSDLYSLGVVLYELTTGRLPFEAEDALAVITQHIHAPVVPPRAKNERIPIPLNDLILSLLEKEPQDRPQSAADVLAILEDPLLLDKDETSTKDLSMLDRIVRGRIVGRQAEYEEARELWHRAANGNGQALLISGEPGIGKTRLTREIITHVEVSGGIALIGECYAESNAPYSAFAQITHQALTSNKTTDIKFSDPVLDDLLKLTPDLRLKHLDIQPNPQLDPETEQQRLFEHMVAFCNQLAENFPLLIVVDDAHWGDSGTLAMLHHLIRRTQKKPIMVLTTYREVELRESRPFNELLLELNRQRQGTRLKLDRLNREQTHEMLTSIFAEEITSEFLDGIYRETDGNPFFIEEVCRALVESGALYFEDGEWHRPSMDELEIPQGVQVAVESRVAKLPKEHQETLRMASILGREFDFDILLEALDVDEDDLIEILETAEEAQMIQEVDGAGEVTFAFVHALVPSAISESVRTLRRRRLHKRAAIAIEKLHPNNFDALAYHYGEAGDETRAYKYYLSAGERTAAAYANADAEEQFLAALDLVEGEAEEAYLLTQIGSAQANQSKYGEARETWKQAINLYQSLGDSDKVAEIYARSGRVAWDGGNTKLNLEICRQGLSVVEGAHDGPGLARLLSEMARACYFNGLHEESEQFAHQALEMAENLSLIDIQAETLITLGMIPELSAEDSLRYLNEAIELAESNHLLRQALRAHNNVGVQYSLILLDYPSAANHYQRAIDIARQIGDSEYVLFSQVNLDWMDLNLGKVKEVGEKIPQYQELLDSLPESGAGGSNFEGLKTGYLTYKGDLNQALEDLSTRHETEIRSGSLQGIWSTSWLIVQISLITGDIARAKGAAQEMVEVAKTGIGSTSPSYSFLSRCYSHEGEIEESARLLEIAHREAENSQTEFFDQTGNLWALADLNAAKKEWDAAWSAYQDLIDLFEEKSFRWHSNVALLDWAEALLARGESDDKEKAHQKLQESLEEFKDMGADGFVSLVQARIEAIG